MKNTRLSDLVVNAQGDTLGALLDNGFIDIYDGVQPESVEEAVTKQTLCVSLRFGAPAFMPAVKGVISAHAISPGVAIATVREAKWARLYRADHKTAIMDISVGTKDANIIVPTTHIVMGVQVSCASLQHSVAKFTPGV